MPMAAGLRAQWSLGPQETQPDAPTEVPLRGSHQPGYGDSQACLANTVSRAVQQKHVKRKFTRGSGPTLKTARGRGRCGDPRALPFTGARGGSAPHAWLWANRSPRRPLARPPVSGTKARPEPLGACSPRECCADPSPGQRMAQGCYEGGCLTESPQPHQSICWERTGPCRSRRKGRVGRKGGGEGRGPCRSPPGLRSYPRLPDNESAQNSPSSFHAVLEVTRSSGMAGGLSRVHRLPVGRRPGPSIHGSLQAWIPEGVATPSSRASSRVGD